MTDGETLFSVPAVTYIDRTPDGLWLFCEPGKQPYTITINLCCGLGRDTVEKIPIEPERTDGRL